MYVFPSTHNASYTKIHDFMLLTFSMREGAQERKREDPKRKHKMYKYSRWNTLKRTTLLLAILLSTVFSNIDKPEGDDE